MKPIQEAGKKVIIEMRLLPKVIFERDRLRRGLAWSSAKKSPFVISSGQWTLGILHIRGKSGDTILINLSRQAAAAGMAIGYPWRRAANRPRAENHRQAGNHRQENKEHKENRDANHFREN